MPDLRELAEGLQSRDCPTGVHGEMVLPCQCDPDMDKARAALLGVLKVADLCYKSNAEHIDPGWIAAQIRGAIEKHLTGGGDGDS